MELQVKENVAQTRLATMEEVKRRWVHSEGRVDRIYQHTMCGLKERKDSRMIRKTRMDDKPLLNFSTNTQKSL